MKLQRSKLMFVILGFALLFLSCTKEDMQDNPSEIVFQVPVLKSDGKTEVYDVVVYPSPFQDYVNVQSQFGDGELIEIQLSDENGEFSMQATLKNGHYTFDVEHFPEGTYYIEMKSEDYVNRAKLLKLNWY